MRQLFLIEIQRCAVSGFVHADISDMGKPPSRRFVQMLETGECSTIEKVLLQVPEGPFDFALRLRVAGPAGDGTEAIVGGKSEEACVVNRLLPVAATDDDLHTIVKTLGRDTFQIRQGRDVLANRCREVLTLDKMHVLAAGISEDVAE